ncbi:hypothetical protein ACO2Q3_08380 [Caulobacter sp. KR2-114]|uniref:hypothetical protein n=1 Tax=Caulobacter sp. KR2-114 TaxID=3400912 RepID=UPI003C022000
MRRASLLLLAVAGVSLGACASNANYNAPNGDANYDALKKASEECKSHGGQLQLKSGGDSTELGDYACKMGKGS